MFAITPAKMIERNRPQVEKLLAALEQRVTELESLDGPESGLIDHYSYTIEKVKADFTACDIPVTDYYQHEEDTHGSTVITTEVDHPILGKSKYDILLLQDDEDEYMNDLKAFIDKLRKANEAGSGSPLTRLAFHAELRRRLAAKMLVVAMTLPAARLVGAAIIAEHRYRLTIEPGLNELTKLGREEIKDRFSDEHLLNQASKLFKELGKANSAIENPGDYRRVELQSHTGIITVAWQTNESRHYRDTTRLHQPLPETVMSSLPGRPLEQVMDHPLIQNLSLKVVAANNAENGTDIKTDELEEHNLIVLQRPLS